jgi:hypothetical protein
MRIYSIDLGGQPVASPDYPANYLGHLGNVNRRRAGLNKEVIAAPADTCAWL